MSLPSWRGGSRELVRCSRRGCTTVGARTKMRRLGRVDRSPNPSLNRIRDSVAVVAKRLRLQAGNVPASDDLAGRTGERCYLRPRLTKRKPIASSET
jgi:hypothetical protein